MTAILVTGAGGFVGRGVIEAAQRRGLRLVSAVRTRDATASPDSVAVGEIGSGTDWSSVLVGVKVVVHLVARTHVLKETAPDSLAAYRLVNVDGTRRLAEQAVSAGVRRLVFVSSIKVNGERTIDRPFSETDPPRPEDPYGRSKLEAEQVLLELGTRTGLEVVIVRPPLVYGPGVRGNLRRLLDLVAGGVPLPFAALDNRRSLVGRENLADLLLVAATHAAAPGNVFLVADQPALSTPELVRRLARGLGMPARLWPVPAGLLRGASRLPRIGDTVSRLTDSLEVDGSRTMRVLEWSPPVSLDEGLDAMTAWYREQSRTT